jgi:hypothetical protein
MFVGIELAGQRAAIVMSFVKSARMNGHDPWAYLRDELQGLRTHRRACSLSIRRKPAGRERPTARGGRVPKKIAGLNPVKEVSCATKRALLPG